MQTVKTSNKSLYIPKDNHFLDITTVSQEIKLTGMSEIENLSQLTIPLTLPAHCEITYDAIRTTFGNRMQIFINGSLLQEIIYAQTNGKKQNVLDITPYLKVGINELRVKCLVTTDNFYENSDVARIVLSGNGQTIIRKEYSTKGSLEPFDQIWMLRVLDQ